jgi:hypothetical protein
LVSGKRSLATISLKEINMSRAFVALATIAIMASITAIAAGNDTKSAPKTTPPAAGKTVPGKGNKTKGNPNKGGAIKANPAKERESLLPPGIWHFKGPNVFKVSMGSEAANLEDQQAQQPRRPASPTVASADSFQTFLSGLNLGCDWNGVRQWSAEQKA